MILSLARDTCSFPMHLMPLNRETSKQMAKIHPVYCLGIAEVFADGNLCLFNALSHVTFPIWVEWLVNCGQISSTPSKLAGDIY